jgi:sec-independent protein translocase protein TatA
MPFGLGTSELVIILLIVLLVFGAKRLPDIGSSLGKGIREFKRSFRDIEHTIDSDQATPPKPLEPTREPEAPKKLSE